LDITKLDRSEAEVKLNGLNLWQADFKVCPNKKMICLYDMIKKLASYKPLLIQIRVQSLRRDVLQKGFTVKYFPTFPLAQCQLSASSVPAQSQHGGIISSTPFRCSTNWASRATGHGHCLQPYFTTMDQPVFYIDYISTFSVVYFFKYHILVSLFMLIAYFIQ